MPVALLLYANAPAADVCSASLMGSGPFVPAISIRNSISMGTPGRMMATTQLSHTVLHSCCRMSRSSNALVPLLVHWEYKYWTRAVRQTCGTSSGMPRASADGLMPLCS